MKKNHNDCENNEVPPDIPLHLKIINIAGEQIEVISADKDAEPVCDPQTIHKIALVGFNVRYIQHVGHLQDHEGHKHHVAPICRDLVHDHNE